MNAVIADRDTVRRLDGLVVGVRVPSDEGRYVVLTCGMCSHEWECSQRMFDYRWQRFAKICCPHCGAHLERAQLQ